MALTDQRQILSARRDVPSTNYSEGAHVPVRGSKKGEIYASLIGKPRVMLADEGSYFVATNPTPGTGIAGIAATGAVSDAESLLLVRNNASVSSGKRLYLDYLRILVTAAGTNGTNHRYVSKVDKGTNRYTSGGSAITPVNPNIDSTETSDAQVLFGALVTTAASTSARLVGSGLLKRVIAIAGDEYFFAFGGDAVPVARVLVADDGEDLAQTVIAPHAPVVLGPEQTFVLALYAASQDGASSYEFELGYWER